MKRPPPKQDQPIPYRLTRKALELEPPALELRAPQELELEQQHQEQKTCPQCS
jgi:hypothetical protein